MKNFDVKLKCVFCGSTDFNLPSENYKPQEGELIKCANCGRLNDFTEIKELAIEDGKEIVFKMAKEEIDKELKKSFKNIKIKI